MNDFSPSYIASLPKVQWRDEIVLTTAQVAEFLGATVKQVWNNFHRNANRFVEGVHFFCITGEDLKKFLDLPSQRGKAQKNIPRLALWTLQGVARHAKILETDEAWRIFGILEENYFGKHIDRNTLETEAFPLLVRRKEKRRKKTEPNNTETLPPKEQVDTLIKLAELTDNHELRDSIIRQTVKLILG